MYVGTPVYGGQSAIESQCPFEPRANRYSDRRMWPTDVSGMRWSFLLIFWAGMDDMNTTTATSSQPRAATTSWTHTYDRVDLNERWCAILVDYIVLPLLQHNVTNAIAVKRA
jgi:hypothetical protein